jgi:hypothetical protein
VGRAFQRDITELYPSMEPYIEALISKKAEVVEARWYGARPAVACDALPLGLS